MCEFAPYGTHRGSKLIFKFNAEATVLKYVDLYTFKPQAVFNRTGTECVCVFVCLWSHVKHSIFKCYPSSLCELLLHHRARGHAVRCILFVQFSEIKQT